MNRRPHRAALLWRLFLCIGFSLGACRSSNQESRYSTPVEKVQSLSDEIAETLGDRWKIFSKNNEQIVERKDLPSTFNMFSPNPHDARLLAMTDDTDTRTEILEKYRVHIPYRIVIREGPHLDTAEVARRLHANRRVPEALAALAEEGIAPHLKMVDAEEERVRTAWKSLEEIPCGSYLDRSIYIYLTHFGAAHTDAAAHKDYYTAAFRIAKLLKPYDAVRLRRGPRNPKWWSAPDSDGDCPYNLFAPLKSVACPW